MRPRKPKTPGRQDLLETKLSELTALIKDLSPQARVEISFEQYENEDAHIHAYELTPGGIATRFGLWEAPEFTVGYLLLFALFLAMGWWEKQRAH